MPHEGRGRGQGGAGGRGKGARLVVTSRTELTHPKDDPAMSKGALTQPKGRPCAVSKGALMLLTLKTGGSLP